MLKYEDLISKLTTRQKIRILTRAGNTVSKDLKVLGIPSINVANLKDYKRDVFPHATALINCWDRDIFSEVAERKGLALLKDGKDLAVVPGAKIKFSPFRIENSEDPFLAASLSRSFSRALAKYDLPAAAAGCYLTPSDVAWMDKIPDKDVIREYLCEPYRSLLGSEASIATITDIRTPSQRYKDTCQYVQRTLAETGGYLLCAKATDANTVDFVRRGVICLDGSALALESAHMCYKKLKGEAERSEMGEAALKAAFEENTAISDEELDASLDRTLDFIFGIAKKKDRPLSDESAEELEGRVAMRSILSSSVLLKNLGATLPLSKSSKVSVLSLLSPTEECAGLADRVGADLRRLGHWVIGSADITPNSGQDSAYLIKRAIDLCKKSDTVILLLGYTHEEQKAAAKNENLYLPAPDLAFSDMISKLGKKVVSVINSGYSFDVEFTRPHSAILYMPLELKGSAEALSKLISGEESPSGKLAYTLYSGSETAFEKARLYRQNGMKEGRFIGYRYYDSANMTVGYPFGHGLTYSSFKYSIIKATESELTISLKNTGRYTATETVQLYLGKLDSAFIRPKKELCGFVRVSLQPGEKKTVSIPYSKKSIFKNGQEITEDGRYELSVGASVSDIRATAEFSIKGERVERTDERLCDYLQTVSNVKQDNFTLEAIYSSMKKTGKNLIFGLATIAIAISLAIFNTTTGLSSPFLGVIAWILASISIIFFILEGVERSRVRKDEIAKAEAANKESFEDADRLPVLSSAKLFAEEFAEDEEEEVKPQQTVEAELDYGEFVDTSFKLSAMAEEFKKFTYERGCKLNAGVSENLLAAMATSRLILVDGMPENDFNEMVLVISEYFGSKTHVDNVRNEPEGANLLFGTDDHGDLIKRSLAVALESASATPSSVQIAAFNGMGAERLSHFLSPFMKYLTSPKNGTVSLSAEGGASVDFFIPANLWMIVNLDELDGVDLLTQSVASVASVIDLGYTKCQKAEEFTVKHGCTRQQLEYIYEKEGTKAELPEDFFKRVDRLEKYGASHDPEYKIGNRCWIAFERHLSLLIMAGMEAADAQDNAVTTRLLSSLSISLAGKIKEDEKSPADRISDLLGEANTARSRHFLEVVAEKALERERIAAAKEKEERERLEREAAEKERLERERLEREAAEKERLEQERLRSEQASRESVIASEAPQGFNPTQVNAEFEKTMAAFMTTLANNSQGNEDMQKNMAALMSQFASGGANMDMNALMAQFSNMTSNAPAAPTVTTEAPVETTEAPVETAETPTETAEAPAEIAETPTETAETPAETAESTDNN